jgi:hypothetical protein
MVEKYISYFAHQPLACITVFSTLLPLAFIHYRKAGVDPSFRLLSIFLIFKIATDIIMLHYATFRLNNIIYYNIGIPVRYVLLSGMFYYKFESKILKKWILNAMIVFLIFSVWDIVSINPDILDLHGHRMVAYATTFESLLMIFWILIYFYETITSLKIPNLLSFPFFWVCSGLLLFYASFAFVAPFLTYVFQWENWLNIGFVSYVPYVFEIVTNIFLCIGVSFFSPRYYAEH